MRRPRPSPRRSRRPRRRCSGCAGSSPRMGAWSGRAPTACRGSRSAGSSVCAHGRDQALAVRACGDHLAAERSRAVAPTVAAVRDRKRQSAVKNNRPLRKFSGVHRRALHISIEAVRKRICSGEERAGRRPRRWLPGSSEGSSRGPMPANPLSSRFLPGDIRMLAGEARDIASDRAGFLGSHPEAGATRAPRKHQ